ncbi:MAG: hypothetical protein ABF617_05025 [Gluconobacter japonicus]
MVNDDSKNRGRWNSRSYGNHPGVSLDRGTGRDQTGRPERASLYGAVT